MVPGGNSQPRMAIHNLRRSGRDRNIGKQTRYQAGTNSRAMNGTDNGFVAIDDVVDQIARFLPYTRTHREIIGHVLHQRQITATGKAHAFPAQYCATHAVISTNITPDFREFTVAVMASSRQLAVGAGFHLDIQHGVPYATTGDLKRLVAAVVNGCMAHGVSLGNGTCSVHCLRC